MPEGFQMPGEAEQDVLLESTAQRAEILQQVWMACVVTRPRQLASQLGRK